MFQYSRRLSRSYLQARGGECGLSCTGFIAALYGHDIGMRELRRRFPISALGATIHDLAEVARGIGLEARGVHLRAVEIGSLRLPAIIHWAGEHFVVLTRCGLRSCVIHDPAQGERVLSREIFSESFTGYALELTPALNFERTPSRKGIGWRQVSGQITGLKRSLAQVLTIASILQLCALAGPLLSQWVVDDAVVSGDTDLVWVICIGLVLSAIVRSLLDLSRAWLSLALSTQLMTGWCGGIMSHLMRLPVAWFESRHVGDVVSRFQSTQAIQQVVSGKAAEIVLDSVFCVGLSVVLFLYSPVLAIVALASIGIYFLLRFLPHGAYHRAIEDAVVKEAMAQSQFIESVRAIQTIKSFGLEDKRSQRWSSSVMDAVNRRFVAQRMMLIFGAGYSTVFGVQSALVLGLGALGIAQGVMSIGMLFAFISYKDDFCTRAQRLVDNALSLRGLRIHLDRLGEIVTEPKEETGTWISQRLVKSASSPTLEVREISYRYSVTSPWIFEKFSLRVSPGEHVALIGPSGSGKSTLAKMLIAICKPLRGEILENGSPIEATGIARWRSLVSAVMQGDQLLSGSLLENISVFESSPDLDRVRRAAADADILADIERMPMGFLTEVGDLGCCLSSGQRQRVLIARALYKRPLILILDEATSHLDVASEHRVNLAISALNISRITISHRPETIAMADRVIDLSIEMRTRAEFVAASF